MKVSDSSVIGYDYGNDFNNISLFKKVILSKGNKDFLTSRITVKNYCLMMIENGHFEWMIDDQIYSLKPKDFILVSPDTKMEKEFKNIEVGSFYKISLNAGFYNQKSMNYSDFSSISNSDMKIIFSHFEKKKNLIISQFHEMYENFKKLEKEYLRKEIGYTARIKSIIDDMIINIYRKSLTQRETEDIPYYIKNLIITVSKDLSHPWTVKEMAEMSHMGITKFTEVIKACTGYSPFDFIIYLRIRESIKMIEKTDKSLTDIAYQTGFYSSQHFSNTFKRIIGKSPKDFRNNDFSMANQYENQY